MNSSYLAPKNVNPKKETSKINKSFQNPDLYRPKEEDIELTSHEQAKLIQKVKILWFSLKKQQDGSQTVHLLLTSEDLLLRITEEEILTLSTVVWYMELICILIMFIPIEVQTIQNICNPIQLHSARQSLKELWNLLVLVPSQTSQILI